MKRLKINNIIVILAYQDVLKFNDSHSTLTDWSNHDPHFERSFT